MGTAVDILLRAPVVPANDVVGWRPRPPGTTVNLFARQPFAAANDVVGYPTSPFAFPSFSEDADPVSNIVAGTQLGNDQSAVSSTSYTFTTTTSAIPAGNLGILISVADNISAVDGDNNEHTTVTGGTGVWTKLGEYCNSGGGAASGATVSVWKFRATGPNPIGTVFTLNFSSAVVEKASTMYGFTVTGGATLTLDTSASPNPISNEVNAQADFGSVSFSGLASRQRLWFRGLGKELNSATAITPSAGFTVTGRTRSQNAASAVIVRGEFLISTSTGETSNPVLAGSGDSAGLFLALIDSDTGQVNATLGAMTTTGAGTVLVQGSANFTFGALTLTGAGESLGSRTATASITFGALTINAVGDVGAVGSGSVFFWGPEMEDGGIATDTDDLEVLETLVPAMIDIDYTGDTTIAPTGTGRTFAVSNMRGVQVHIQIDLGNDIAVAESLMAMVSFAKRGGLVGFALHRSYAFLAQMETGPTRGDTSFDYGANALDSWGGDEPSLGWRLYMASPLPHMRREIVQVAGRVGTTITTEDPVVFTLDPEGGVIILRHKYFFPFLRYISGDVVVSEPQGGVYRFDAMFEEDTRVEQLFLSTEVQLHTSLGSISVTGAGTVAVNGQVNATFGGISVTGNGTTQSGSGVVNDTLGGLTVTGAGTILGGRASLDKILGTLTVTSAGHSSEQGVGAIYFDWLTATAAGDTTNQGTLNTQLGGLTVTGAGTVN